MEIYGHLLRCGFGIKILLRESSHTMSYVISSADRKNNVLRQSALDLIIKTQFIVFLHENPIFPRT